MTEEKKLTDDELENATGAGPSISAQKTSSRGTYGTGQVESSSSEGETEPNPIRDELLGQVQGGAGYSISSEKQQPRGAATEGPSEGRETPGVVGNTDPV
jgi:hypothetical protein